jgi:hypothetical protein
MFDLIRERRRIARTRNAGKSSSRRRASNDPWPLEPGPLTPIDPGEAATPPGERTAFQALVAEAIDAIGGSDGVLQAASSRMSEGALSTGVGGDDDGALSDAADALDRQVQARGAFSVADDVAQLGALADSITALEGEHADPPPTPQIPNEPQPAGYPGEDGTDGEPGRENPRHPDLPGDDDDTRRRGPHE